jgi:hypothetical protein
MVKRQRTAFPPNFVHSLDGSHMMMTAVACKEAGLNFAGLCGLADLSLLPDTCKIFWEILLFHDVHLQGSMIHTGHMHAMLMK